MGGPLVDEHDIEPPIGEVGRDAASVGAGPENRDFLWHGVSRLAHFSRHGRGCPGPPSPSFLLFLMVQDVDARDKRGHDGREGSRSDRHSGLRLYCLTSAAILSMSSCGNLANSSGVSLTVT